MIGLDTNVLLRLMLRDDDGQYRRALTFLKRELNINRKGYVAAIVLVEFAWTLRRVYRFSNADMLSAVEGLLDVSNLVFERQSLLFAAIELCRNQNIDLSDALIAAINREDGCSRTVTFDGAFAASGEAALVP